MQARLGALLAEAPQWTQGKRRLHQLLVEEGQAVGATLVKAYVAEWKRRRQEVFIPLVYEPGDLGEIDFFEVWVDVAGVRQKAWLFVLRLMASGRDFGWLYPRQDQVCFLDGHVRASAHLGGVPRRLLYDNLRPAVARILVGAARVLTARMQALVAHYAFEPCFARPGTGHDKGGVESRGRAIRWQDLVPIPAGPDLETISQRLLARLDGRLATQRDAEGRTLGERFAAEHAQLLPLPARPFAAAAVHVLPVSDAPPTHLYAQADVFVLASEGESFGMVAAEAAAAGTPVIVSDRCGIAGFFRDGEALVVPYERGAIVEAIRRVLTDAGLRERLTRGGPEAARRTSWDHVAEMQESIYRTVTCD